MHILLSCINFINVIIFTYFLFNCHAMKQNSIIYLGIIILFREKSGWISILPKAWYFHLKNKTKHQCHYTFLNWLHYSSL